eukprot:4635874-Amphidinium_carterae.1
MIFFIPLLCTPCQSKIHRGGRRPEARVDAKWRHYTATSYALLRKWRSNSVVLMPSGKALVQSISTTESAVGAHSMVE